jgi:crotonobetainyl-CoA:carnitine CoA-transferase CaiB-like acyl-CoA transferase
MSQQAAGVPGVLPLQGIRVLEVSTVLGAYCGRLLADAGADVVKLELPGGDALRRQPPFAGDTSLAFAYYHANKRSVIADYQDEASLPQLRALAAQCDVIIASPTATHPIAGFDPASRTFSWAPDGAVACFVTPFGLTGPHRHWRATHLTSYALSGLMFEQGPVAGPPVVIPGQICYDHAGTHAAVCVLAALRERPREGGQAIDLSAHEVLTQSFYSLYIYTSADEIARPNPPGQGSSVGIWKCRDGLVQVVLSTDKHWFGLVELLGRPAALTDPTWGNPQVRGPFEDKIVEVVTPLIAAMSRQEFVSAGQRLGVPCAFVNTVGDFVKDEQPRSRGFFVPQALPGMAEFDSPGRPFASTVPLLEPHRRPAPVSDHTAAAAVIAEWSAPSQQGPQQGTQQGPPPGAPLSDLRVLCLGTAVAGALSGTALAELGANVVKVEAPGRPDNMRRLSQPRHMVATEPSGAKTSPMFGSNNRTIRSLALDMKEPGAVDLFLRLVAVSDVIIENYSPSVMPKWGLTYERIAAANPGVIMLSLTGFGHTGPRAAYLAYGSTVSSFVGVTQAWGYPSPTFFDYISQAHGVFAVLAALAARDRSGAGTHVDLAEVEVGAAVVGPLMLDYTVNGRDSEPLGNNVPGALYSAVLPCHGEDAWLAIELEDEQDARRLHALLGAADRTPGQSGLDPGVESKLRNWAASRTAYQAMRGLQRAGLAAGAVQSNEDVTRDPQHRARGFLIEMHHPDMGTIEYAAPPHRLSKTPARAGRHTPRLGEHNLEVLTGWAGLSPDEAAAWSWPKPASAGS